MRANFETILHPFKTNLSSFQNFLQLFEIFDQNLDLNEQKQKISNKLKDLHQQISEINVKLKKKSFLKNAPKQIVAKEKKALIDYKNELKKLNTILNSIKN